MLLQRARSDFGEKFTAQGCYLASFSAEQVEHLVIFVLDAISDPNRPM